MNLNEAPQYSGDRQYDPKAIDFALRQLAPRWIPEIFTSGKIERENGKRGLRVGDISGRPASNRGSCRIWLDGPKAGSWVDFDNRHKLKGGPVSTIKEHFQLEEGTAYARATEIILQYGGQHYIDEAPKHTNGHANGSAGTPAVNRHEHQISFYWSQRQPANGTLVEKYWDARKLGKGPPAAFGDDPDLVFAPSATQYDTNRGWPTMICRFRYPDGTLTGALHLTHFLEDGSWHLGRAGHKAKIVWGPRINGGLIMLAPIGEDGALGIGEGIESTAAGMAYFPGVPGWAAGDTSSMVKLAEWLLAREAGRASGAATGPGSAADLTWGIKRLLVWGDAGKGGVAAARTLADAARAAGVPRVELYLPRGDDDLAADRMAGLLAPEPLTDAEIAALGPAAPAEQAPLPLDAEGAAPSLPGPAGLPAVWPPAGEVSPIRATTAAELETRFMTIEKGVSGEVVIAACRDIAAAQLDPVSHESMINLLFRRSGIKKTTLVEAIRNIQGEIIPPERNHEGRGTKPWLSGMALGNDGDPKGIMANAAKVLREADEWKDVLWFDEFSQEIWFKRRPPYDANPGVPCERKWTDADELATTEWMQFVAGIHAQKHIVFDAVLLVASEHKYHQVRDYLLSLVWDKVERWDYFPINYLGYEHTGPKDETEEEKTARRQRNIYVWAAMKKWGIGAVARAFKPGVKNDAIPILTGMQGYGKSTAIKRLVGEEWFTDDMPEFGTKDAAIQLRGIWVAELSELDSLRSAELSKVKAFASRTTDRYRPPYGRVPIDVPRECAFIGTVNEKEFLRDMTGNRRYWPIPIHNRIDVVAIERDRDQLWAEAVHLYLKGEKWYFDDAAEKQIIEAASVEQEARRQHDSWETPIENYLDGNKPYTNRPIDDVSTDEILIDALFISDKSKWGRGEEMRIGKIMQKLGWIRKQKRIAGSDKRPWRYFRPPDAPLSSDVSPP